MNTGREHHIDRQAEPGRSEREGTTDPTDCHQKKKKRKPFTHHLRNQKKKAEWSGPATGEEKVCTRGAHKQAAESRAGSPFPPKGLMETRELHNLGMGKKCTREAHGNRGLGTPTQSVETRELHRLLIPERK